MALDPRHANDVPSTSELDSAIGLAEAGSRAMSAVTGVPVPFSRKSVPTHVRIRSILEDARRSQERAVREFEEQYDFGRIEREIEESDAWAKRASARVDALAGRLSEPPPGEATTLQATEAESLALGAALLLGASPGPTVDASVAGVRERQGKEFENAIRSYGARQQAAVSEMGIAERDLGYARSQGLSARERRDRGRDAVRGFRLESAIGISERQATTALAQLQQQIEAEQAERTALFNRETDAQRFMLDVQLEGIRASNKQAAETVERILKGMDGLRFGADDPRGTEMIEQLSSTLEQMGMVLSPAQKALYRQVWGQNHHDATVKEALARLGLTARFMGVQPKSAPGEIPDAGFVPLDPGLGGGGLVIDRPNAGKGETDVQQLADAVAALQPLKDAWDAAQKELETYESRATSDEQRKVLRNGKYGKAVTEARGGYAKAASAVESARRAVIANASPEYKSWLLGLYNDTIERIKDVPSGVGGVQMPDGSWVETSGREDGQSKLRSWFLAQTGFTTDDKAIGRLRSAPASRSGGSGQERYRPMIKAAALAAEVPFELLDAIVRNESAYDPEARSPAGAIGLGQLMPGTARELGVDPRDPEQNLSGAARYLRKMLDRFGWNVEKAVRAYNAGPGNIGGADAAYVQRVVREYEKAVSG